MCSNLLSLQRDMFMKAMQTWHKSIWYAAVPWATLQYREGSLRLNAYFKQKLKAAVMSSSWQSHISLFLVSKQQKIRSLCEERNFRTAEDLTKATSSCSLVMDQFKLSRKSGSDNLQLGMGMGTKARQNAFLTRWQPMLTCMPICQLSAAMHEIQILLPLILGVSV